MLSLEEIFPPFALRISCGPVLPAVLRDADLPELVDLVGGGIHPPGSPMPFLRAWHEEPFHPGSGLGAAHQGMGTGTHTADSTVGGADALRRFLAVGPNPAPNGVPHIDRQ